MNKEPQKRAKASTGKKSTEGKLRYDYYRRILKSFKRPIQAL